MYQQKLFQWEIGSIMKSKEIVLMAFGESKADAIKGMIEGPVTNHLPASVLQNHDNVVVIIDEEAASKFVIFNSRLKRL